MKKFTYKPSSEEFTGEVEIVLPSLRQKMKIFKECNFKPGVEGEVDSMSQIESMSIMLDLTGDYVKKVSLKHSSGLKFKNWMELTEDSDCDDVCNDIMNIVLEGKLGKR